MDKTNNYLLKKKKKLRKCCCFSRTHSVFYFFNSSFQEFYPHFFIIILCSLFIVHFFHQNRKQKIFFIITLPDWFYMSLALHPDFSSLWRPPSAQNFILNTFYCWILPSLSIVSFTTTAMDLRRQILASDVFSLHSFPIFDTSTSTTSFWQGFLGSQ